MLSGSKKSSDAAQYRIRHLEERYETVSMTTTAGMTQLKF
jgi:hypothetical protein